MVIGSLLTSKYLNLLKEHPPLFGPVVGRRELVGHIPNQRLGFRLGQRVLDNVRCGWGHKSRRDRDAENRAGQRRNRPDFLRDVRNQGGRRYDFLPGP